MCFKKILLLEYSNTHQKHRAVLKITRKWTRLKLLSSWEQMKKFFNQTLELHFFYETTLYK